MLDYRSVILMFGSESWVFSGDSIASTIVRFNLPDEEKCHNAIYRCFFSTISSASCSFASTFDLLWSGHSRTPQHSQTFRKNPTLMERSQCWWKVQYPGPGQDTCFSKGSRLQVAIWMSYHLPHSTRKLVGSVFSQLNQLHRTTLTDLKLWKWTSSKQCRQLEIFCLCICRSWPWISVTFISCYESHEMQCSSIIRNEETPKQLPFFSRPLSHHPPPNHSWTEMPPKVAQPT